MTGCLTPKLLETDPTRGRLGPSGFHCRGCFNAATMSSIVVAFCSGIWFGPKHPCDPATPQTSTPLTQEPPRLGHRPSHSSPGNPPPPLLSHRFRHLNLNLVDESGANSRMSPRRWHHGHVSTRPVTSYVLCLPASSCTPAPNRLRTTAGKMPQNLAAIAPWSIFTDGLKSRSTSQGAMNIAFYVHRTLGPGNFLSVHTCWFSADLTTSTSQFRQEWCWGLRSWFRVHCA